MFPFDSLLLVAGFVFFCGLAGLILRRNLIFMLMSIELMLNAVNMVFVGAAYKAGNADGQIMVFFVITVAACEAALGLAMVIALFRRYGNIDSHFFRALRG